MNVVVKLFATFREFLPDAAIGGAVGVRIAEHASVGELIETLHLPSHLPRIVLVNGHATHENSSLSEGDTVSICPPLVGGL